MQLIDTCCYLDTCKITYIERFSIKRKKKKGRGRGEGERGKERAVTMPSSLIYLQLTPAFKSCRFDLQNTITRGAKLKIQSSESTLPSPPLKH